MKLDEILKVSANQQRGYSLDQFDLSKAEQVSTSEGGIPLVLIPAVGSAEVLMYALMKDEKFVTQIVGEFHSVFGEKYFIIGRTWTDPQYRGKGLATALYSSLVRNLGIKILSDGEQSPEAVKLWKSLARRHSAKVLDVKSGEKSDWDGISDYPYSDEEDEGIKFRLVLEKRKSIIPEIAASVLSEYVYYTDPQKEGAYE